MSLNPHLTRVRSARTDRIPAPLFFLASGASMYGGAGLAVSLFPVMPATTVAWWRITVGAVFLLIWRRPWARRWSSRGLAVAALFGVVTATMNVLFYSAIARLPLGTAVSLEFLGPVAVALVAGRGWRPRAAALAAMAGVASISGLGLDLGAPGVGLGLALILAAGGAWAGYILLARRVAGGSGLDALAVGMVAGSLAYLPLAASTAGLALASGRLALLVCGVGLLSTVVPYSLDQIAMRRLSASAFSLLSALLPATSVLIGLVMLRQVPNAGELVGLVLISVAVALAGWGRPADVGDRPHPPGSPCEAVAASGGRRQRA